MSEKANMSDSFRQYHSKDDYVRKGSLPCVVMTVQGKIEGDIHKRDAFRIIDELNAAKAFIPVTNAKVYEDNPDKFVEADFLVLRADQIVWVYPL
jgi:hypothetical protein